MRRVLPILTLALLACHEHRFLGPGSPNPNTGGSTVGAEYVLLPGDRLPLPDSTIAVTFHSVTQDSRCPADVVCVWAGDAELLFSVAVGRGMAVPFTLHTTLAPRDTTIGPYRLHLTRVEPYPRSNVRIDPSQYRATLRVAMLPD